MRMQYRITLSVVLGMALILGVFAYLSVSAVRQSRDAAQEERLVWAQAVALHVDDVSRRTMAQVETMAQSIGHEVDERDPYIGQDIDAFGQSVFAEHVALLGSDGRLVWTDGVMTGGDDDVLRSFAKPVLTEGKSAFALCPGERSAAGDTLCMAAPVREGSERLYGALALQFNPHRQELGLMLSPWLGEGAHIELINSTGKVIVSDLPGDTDSVVHAAVLGPFIAQRISGVKVHEMPSDSPIKTHVVAYAPLSTLPWGVAVEQDRDVALAAPARLQRKLLLFGLLTLAGVALLAWLDARRVVRPLRMLTAGAARMAGGDLTTPIDVRRNDEVGMLARSFEKMRSRLKTSLEEVEERDAKLEERVQERTREVERLLAELRAKEDLRSHLLEKLISAQEEERARIARELHDETAQSLAGIVMDVEAAEGAIPPGTPALAEGLVKVRSLAQDTIQGIRKLIVDLRPAALDDLGLMPALRAYADERLVERGVSVQIEASQVGPRLPRSVESSLFRVVQEAIANIARHAEAKNASIRLQQNGQRLTLLVADDGKGFDLEEVLNSPDSTRALGLLGMQERVGLCGGSFKVESEPGRGTRIRAEIPLPGEDGHG